MILQIVIDVSNLILKKFSLTLKDLNKLFLLKNILIELLLINLNYYIEIYIDRDSIDAENKITFINN